MSPLERIPDEAPAPAEDDAEEQAIVIPAPMATPAEPAIPVAAPDPEAVLKAPAPARPAVHAVQHHPAPAPSRHHHVAGRAMSFLIGMTGWIVLFASVIFFLMLLQRIKNDLRTVDASYADSVRQYEAGAAARREAFNQAIQEVNREFLEKQKVFERLQAEVHGLESGSRRLAEELSRSAAASGISPAPAAPLAIPEVPVAAGDVTAKLQADLQKLLVDYEAVYGKLRPMLVKLVASRDPVKLQAFYDAAKDTPLGPAALFYAAEIYADTGKTPRAIQAFVELSGRYSDSEYALEARNRVNDLRAGKRREGEARDLGIIPYRPLAKGIR